MWRLHWGVHEQVCVSPCLGGVLVVGFFILASPETQKPRIKPVTSLLQDAVMSSCHHGNKGWQAAMLDILTYFWVSGDKPQTVNHLKLFTVDNKVITNHWSSERQRRSITPSMIIELDVFHLEEQRHKQQNIRSGGNKEMNQKSVISSERHQNE